ncbi:uroporphyrinogen-III C-methyltransferase [Arthrobacter ginkgonis]|uniref:Uroporphyrinogen-III C-methyltransferase n=1 Tax=Arthrobacter ginkgonis TaxID=1630594 RepID=A0ABP7CFH8_9MICC
MSDLYPASLRLLGRTVVMVGAGAVTARRIGALLDAGARVRLIAPAAHPELRDLAENGLIDWQRRDYAEGDLDEAWLVHTATGCPATDARVGADAEARRLWCVNATDHATASAWTPAVARFDDVVVAVNTAADPRRAAAIRDAIRVSHATGALPLRHRRPAASSKTAASSGPAASATTAEAGRIALVGGGPGDIGLITVRGRTLLAEADVVVADRLGPRGLLAELDPAVRVIEVGKAPGAHLATQEEINEILVAEARAGHLVVRLKGGDPYVLGRGGEEAAYARARGIDVEVVPGVTSAVSVPAAAGIPVTHRGLATGFSVVTGHQDLGEVPVRQDHTLVLLMGIARLGESVAGLLARGMDPATPVGIVERGWTPEQRVCIGTLETIAADAGRARIGNPAVIVIGRVVSLSPYAGPVSETTAPEAAPEEAVPAATPSSVTAANVPARGLSLAAR